MWTIKALSSIIPVRVFANTYSLQARALQTFKIRRTPLCLCVCKTLPGIIHRHMNFTWISIQWALRERSLFTLGGRGFFISCKIFFVTSFLSTEKFHVPPSPVLKKRNFCQYFDKKFCLPPSHAWKKNSCPPPWFPLFPECSTHV